MKDLTLVKMGGSVITDKSKPFTARIDVIQKLVKKIKSFKNEDTDVIIGHGGGSFPHVPASKYQTQKGLINKDSIRGLVLTADAAIQINRIVVSEFLRQKVNVLSFAPLSFIYDKKIMLEPIKKALDLGVTPLIYGDVMMNKNQGFEIFSTERSIDALAIKLAKNYNKIKIIYYSDTNGVYDDKGKTIPLITQKNFKEIKKYIVGSRNTDVTGGMIHKVLESLKLVKKINVEVFILNGFELNNKGTKISKFI